MIAGVVMAAGVAAIHDLLCGPTDLDSWKFKEQIRA
jgi:hypothetical protein